MLIKLLQCEKIPTGSTCITC